MKPVATIPFPRPRLLISFRDLAELQRLNLQGLDIIDLKEPERGPLGPVDGSIVHAVRAWIGPQRTLSVALGEVRDFSPENWTSLWPVVDFVKLGLSGLRTDRNWADTVRRQIAPLSTATNVVLVAYADAQAARSPEPESLVDLAAELPVRQILVDTYLKNGQSLVEHLSLARLQRLIQQSHGAGIGIGLAGSLGWQHLDSLLDLEPDVIGVRGLVTQGERTQAIDPTKVQRLREIFEKRWNRQPSISTRPYEGTTR